MRNANQPGGPSDDAREIAAECVGARLRMLNRAVTRMYDEQLRSYGIKFSQMNILTVVGVRGPVQSGEVARILSLEKSTVSRNLAILETNGWVESEAGDAGNTRLISATASGRELLTRAKAGWQIAQDQVTALLGERTAKALRRAADQLGKGGHV